MSTETPVEKAEEDPRKIDDENPEIIIKIKEDPEETPSPEKEEESLDTAKEEAAKKEPIKCPICGTKNLPGSTECALCKTLLSISKSGKLKVKSPKLPGDILMMIDIEDPVTRKKLEELAMIPGVSRVKALYLFQSGIASIEEFVEKAFHGERLSKNFSRTVTNKLLMASIKAGKGGEEDAKLICPSCDAPNEPDVTKCKVCGFEIEKDMQAINMDDVSDKLTGTVEEVFGELMESDDFSALPESLKAQMAQILDSDDFEDIGEVTAEMELFDLGEEEGTVEPDTDELPVTEDAPEPAVDEEPDDTQEPVGHEEPETVGHEVSETVGPASEQINEETEPDEEETYSFETAAEEPEKPEPEPEAAKEPEPQEPEQTEEPEPEVKEPAKDTPAPKTSDKMAAPSDKMAAQKKKIRETLLEKIEEWNKSGYDITGLEEYVDDLKEFKVQAKVTLKKGKVIKEKYMKQMEIWREKGFDVSELEPLLETDIEAFKTKTKDVLKGQKDSTGLD